MVSKAFKLAEAMVSNPVMSDMVANPTETPTKIAAVETKTATISAGGEISAKNITTNNTLTQSFDSNQTITFNLTDSINSVSPIVSVFKEIPQPGVSSKGNWDVNANATNYEFFDEKPISYSSVSLTPSATGDGTFTSSNPVLSGYDFTNFAYDSVTASTGISGNNEEIRFNNDGTKLYILSDNGPNGDGVYQFSLSTAYDISTLSYDSVYYNSTQGTSVRDIQFNADGTKMFILHSNTQTIYRYSLSTAFNVGTASYDNVSLLVNYATATPMGFFFNGNATKLYVIIAGGSNSGDSTVYERQLPGAYDISSATAVSTFLYNEPDLPAGTTEAYASSGLFNNDGTKMYLNIQRMPISSNKAIIEYDLSTAYDLTTISRTSIQYLTTGTGNPGDNPRGMAWNGDGTKLITLTESGNLFRFTSSGSTVFSSSDVGKKVVGNSGSAIITSTAGAYKSVTAFADTSAISSWQLFGAEGKSDGTGISLTASSAGGFDISGAEYTGNTVNIQAILQTIGSVPGASGSIYGSYLKNDGTMFYVQWYQGYMYQVPLTTAYDISSATATGGAKSNIAMTQVSSIGDIYFKPDGTRLYVTDWSYGSDSVSQYNLSTPWDITTMSYGGEQTFTHSNLRTPYSVFFSADGTKMYTTQTDWSTGNPWFINRVTLSTPWDVTTASQTPDTNQTYNLTNNVTGTVIIYGNGQISPDGTKIVLANSSHNNPQQLFILLTMSTPYDLSTISVTEKTLAHNSGSFPSFTATPDGLKIYTIGGGIDVYEFNIGEAASVNYNSYSPALTNSSNGQINSSSWLDINSMTADETKNDGDIFYAVSTDNRTSWGVAKGSDGVRKIARNNSGTWQYNNDVGSLVGFDYANATATGSTLTVDVSNVGIAGGSNQGIIFNSDGTKFYLVYQATGGNSRIYQVTLGTAWDLTSGTTKYTFDPGVTQISAGSMGFNQNGTALYIAWRAHPGTARYFKKFTLSTAWDLSTASGGVNSANLNSSGAFETCRGLTVGLNEEFIVTTDYAASDDHLAKFTFATAGDVTSTITKSDSINVTSYTNFPPFGDLMTQISIAGPQFLDNGNKLFFMNYNYGGDAYIINLTSAYDITSGTFGSTTGDIPNAGTWMSYGVKPDGTRLYIFDTNNIRLVEYNTGDINYGTSETWVNGTNNNEHATLQQALGAQSFNRMNKAQLDAIADGYHFSQDSADTLDLMIAPYAASGASPISDGVTINYDAEALVREAVAGTDYIAEFPSPSRIVIKSLINGNLKIRAQ